MHLDRLHAGVLNTPGTDRESGFFELMTAIKSGTYLRSIDYAQQRTGRKNRGVILRRTQDSRTQQKYWKYVGSDPVFQGYSWQCKVRRVKAMDYLGNSVASGFWTVHKTCYEEGFGSDHANDAEKGIGASYQYRFKLALDTPNFDDTVSHEVMVLEDELVLRPLLDWLLSRGVISADYHTAMVEHFVAAREYEFLAPARFKTEDACIWNVFGHVQSGFRGTTGLDMDIQWVIAQLIKFLFAKRGVKVSTGNYGDDLRLMTNDPRVFDVLEDVLDELETLIHVRLTLDPDDMYLQVSMGTGLPSFFRQLCRKQNRELKEQPLSDIHAALSLRASYERLRGMAWDTRSHPLAEEFFRTVTWCFPRYAAAAQLASSLSLTQLSTLAARTVGVAAAWLDDFTSDDRSGVSSFIIERDELLAELLANEKAVSPRTGIELPRDLRLGTALDMAQRVPWELIDAFYRDAIRKARETDALLAQYGERLKRIVRSIHGE